MKCNTLISIIGKYNHYSILAALNLKPQRVVFIREQKDEDCYANTETCIKQRLANVKVIEHIIKGQTPQEIKKVIALYDSEDTYFNLSGGGKLMSLLAFQAAHDTELTLIYVDNDHGKILLIDDEKGVSELAPLEIELTVEDIVCSTGAEILKNSTYIFDRKEVKELIQYLVSNYDMWKQVKDILRNSHIIRQDEFKPLLIEVDSSRLSYLQLKAMERFLQVLEAKRLISKYHFYFDHIEFALASREAKSFVMTAGSWLEALTYISVKELREVNDAISGMLFVWEEEVKVHNELDVVAAVDSHLVCVSCKDTEKYDVEDLNELEVYAEHLGGRKVTKILVSTQPPERGEMIFQRAEEMDISIVLFNGDIKGFKEQLHRILMN